MNQKVVAIVGLSGTGKSLVTEYIYIKYHFKKIYFGGIIINELQRRGLEVNSNNEKIVREELRATHGMDAIARLSIEKIEIELKKMNCIIIDGLYSFSEYIFLKDILIDQLILIAIHTEKKIRYQRLANRDIRSLKQEEVDRRDFFEITMIEKGGPIAIADYHVINNGEISDLYNSIDLIFKSKLNLV
jgi:dephospho-CoA kinase